MNIRILKSRKRNVVVTKSVNNFSLQKLWSSWWKESQQGLIGKTLEIGVYVKAFGYCNIKTTPYIDKKIVLGELDIMPIMIFNAYDLKCISEQQYNSTLYDWLNGIIKKKYTSI